MTDQFDVDLLKIYFGDPYPVSENIVIHQPSIQEIMDYGENEFFGMLYCFIGNTTYRKLSLWQNGIDWNRISDFELFCNLVHLLPQEKTEILFGDIDFEKFELYKIEVELPEIPPDKKLTRSEKRQRLFDEFDLRHVFVNEEQQIVITVDVYKIIARVLREMVQMFPKSEYTVGKTSKELLIQEELEKNAKAEREGTKDSSILQPLVSFCVNHPGFKYKKSELRDVQINEFMDSVKRLQIYESTHALYGGIYSGFCDTSKIPRSEFDFMRPIKQK